MSPGRDPNDRPSRKTVPAPRAAIPNLVRAPLATLLALLAAILPPTSAAIHRARAAPAEQPVKITLQVALETPERTSADPRPEFEFALPRGLVLDALPVPDHLPALLELPPRDPRRPDDPVLRVRTDPARSPRAVLRVRIEAPLDSSLILRHAGRRVAFPLADLVRGPLVTPESHPARVRVERLPWDVLEVRLLPPDPRLPDGAFPPSSDLRLAVALNPLGSQNRELGARLRAEMRRVDTGESVWWTDTHLIVPNNRNHPVPVPLDVRLPETPGLYALQIAATLETFEPRPPGIGIIAHFRAKRQVRETTAHARSLAILVRSPEQPAPETQPAPPEPANPPTPTSPSADQWEPAPAPHRGPLPRIGAQRLARADRGLPSAERFAREAAREILRLPPATDPANPDSPLRQLSNWREWLPRSEPADLSPDGTLPPADARGVPWIGLVLNASKPQQPHTLTLRLERPRPQAPSPDANPPPALAVALLAPDAPVDPSAPPRLRALLRLQNPPAIPAETLENPQPQPESNPAPANQILEWSWTVRPDSPAVVLLLANRDPAESLKILNVALREAPETPLPAPAVEPAPDARSVAIRFRSPADLEPLGYRHPDAPALLEPRTLAARLARDLARRGADAVVLPESLARPDPLRLDGQFLEDPLRPDPLPALAAELQRLGFHVWIELEPDARAPGRPPAPHDPDAPELWRQRLDALLARLRTDAEPKRSTPVRGLLLPLGLEAAAARDTAAADDPAVFRDFVHDSFDAEARNGIPPIDDPSPRALAERQAFLKGRGAIPWAAWSARRIGRFHADLARVVRERDPELRFAVVVPLPADTPADELDAAWSAAGYDPRQWPAPEADGPHILPRLVPCEIPHDRELQLHLNALPAARIAAHLDRAARPGRPRAFAVGADPAPAPPAPLFPDRPAPAWNREAHPECSDDPLAAILARAFSTLDPELLLVDAELASGRDELLRQFARLLRRLPPRDPAAPPQTRPVEPRVGLALRTHNAPDALLLALANDAPHPVTFEAWLRVPPETPVIDLARSVKLLPEREADRARVVIRLAPRQATVLRVEDPRAALENPVAHFDDDTRRKLDLRAREIAERLRKWPAPPNPDPSNPGANPNSNANPNANPNPNPLPAAIDDETLRAARLDLLRALQAYREGRLDDFLRIAESPRVQRAARALEPPRTAPAPDATAVDSPSNDLPPRRRFR